MVIIYAAIAVGLVTFILYALERRSKNEPIAWENAMKLSLFGGLIASGVVFATTAEIPAAVTEVAKTVATEVPSVQDMFVGTPSF